MLVCIRRAGGREFQIVGAAGLKLRAPNKVRTYGMESRLVLDNLGNDKHPKLTVRLRGMENVAILNLMRYLMGSQWS